MKSCSLIILKTELLKKLQFNASKIKFLVFKLVISIVDVWGYHASLILIIMYSWYKTYSNRICECSLQFILWIKYEEENEVLLQK